MILMIITYTKENNSNKDIKYFFHDDNNNINICYSIRSIIRIWCHTKAIRNTLLYYAL